MLRLHAGKITHNIHHQFTEAHSSSVSRTNCTHVHPGYGFLSENPALAHQLSQTNPPITFVGPSLETLHIASDKLRSRDLATSQDVPISPGARISSSADVRAFIDSGVGYPVMIKALDGGGGRGIRVVQKEGDIEEAYKRYTQQLLMQEYKLKFLPGALAKVRQDSSSLKKR